MQMQVHAQWLLRARNTTPVAVCTSGNDAYTVQLVRTSIVLRPEVVMASLRHALGARLTGLSLPESFPLRGDSKPESMEVSEPLELRPLTRQGSSTVE